MTEDNNSQNYNTSEQNNNSNNIVTHIVVGYLDVNNQPQYAHIYGDTAQQIYDANKLLGELESISTDSK